MTRIFILGLLAVGCSNGPLMTPGQDCRPCHHDFSVSGTLFTTPDAMAENGLEGASVVVTGADGQSLSLDTNAAGNFYTRERLTYPLTVEVHLGDSVRRMGPLVEAPGSCNSCHTLPATGSASGRAFINPTSAN